MTGTPLWFKICCAFADKYGWGPERVADLTLDQLWMYLAGGNPDEDFVDWEDPELFKARLIAEMDSKPPKKKGK